MCYSIIDQASLKSVTDRWFPEIDANCAGVPIILVGTKNDLRSKPDIIEQLKAEGSKPVSAEDGQKVAAHIKAYKYIECSALTQENLQEVFQETIRAVINPQKAAAPSGGKKADKKDPKRGSLFGSKADKKSDKKKDDKKKDDKKKADKKKK